MEPIPLRRREPLTFATYLGNNGFIAKLNAHFRRPTAYNSRIEAVSLLLASSWLDTRKRFKLCILVFGGSWPSGHTFELTMCVPDTINDVNVQVELNIVMFGDLRLLWSLVYVFEINSLTKNTKVFIVKVRRA